MNIVILGAGEIGFHLAESLERERHDVCVIEMDDHLATQVRERLDVRVVQANGATASNLGEAGAAECDIFLGLSSNDHTNLVAASLAKSLGARTAAARVHGEVQREEWLFDYRKHFNIDYLFSPERLAAVELAKFIRNPHALLVEELARGKIELQQTAVAAGSRAAGTTLLDLALPPRTRIALVHRDGNVFVPTAATKLRAGDAVSLIGAHAKLTRLLPLFQTSGTPEQHHKRVFIFGGGEYGFALAQMLESDSFRTRIMESNQTFCDDLSYSLQHTTVIRGDATSVAQLKEEQVGNVDFFVAATRDDEDNVMTCLQAKNLGAKHCITLIHRADYADAISRNSDQLGIMGAVSPRVATAKDLLRFLTDERGRALLTFEGGVQITEARVQPGCLVADRKVKEIRWPAESGLLALMHRQQAVVPSADDTIAAGDDIVAVVSERSRREVARLLEPR